MCVRGNVVWCEWVKAGERGKGRRAIVGRLEGEETPGVSHSERLMDGGCVNEYLHGLGSGRTGTREKRDGTDDT